MDDHPRFIEVDERGFRCPHPVIAVGRVSRAHGDDSVRIVLLADDIATKSDIPAWCRMTKATLISMGELPDGSGYRFEIQT